ncbi:hypothetical protein DL95DRAFT_329043 [Leptodontidium sp. 2 PMI_412]|nr:hypothetical protein DL95DRAFT_329043 [Leptodontidium sp. 2 PMI_412]
MYSTPTVPSQPHRQSVGQTLELRRQGTRRQRQLRFNRNPIVESSQYQAYRARQNREGSDEDKIWPEVLEDAFLDDNRLFPPNTDPKNGFEDSFKDDPCLRALSIGRLPRNKYDYHEQPTQVATAPNSLMRPVLFWLLMTSSSLSIDERHQDVHEEDLYNEGLVAHRFSRLSAQRQRGSLDSISSWRQKFPFLQQLYTSGELDCEIIHMEASLNLLTTQPPEGSELCSRMVLSMPGIQHDTEWRIVTTLSKPPELYRDQISDPPLEAQAFGVDVTSMNDGETQIKVPFPASPWAQAFSCLRSIQSKYEEKQENSFNTGMGSTRPACDYVDLISMYQEVQSAAGPDSPFVRRTIILWTFRQASRSERNGTNWRYVDPAPVPRRMCMSPSPHPSHHLQANMNENFNSWSDAPLQLQHPSMLDPFVQGLATPPHTAGLQSPFAPPHYGYGQSYDMPNENLSFVSNTTTIDSDSTLVDNDVATNIDNFLSNSHVHLADFEASQGWQLPVTESFDADPTWANYTVPASTPALGWDSNDAKTHAWPDLSTDGKTWDHHTIEETGEKEWAEHVGTSPAKGSANYIEQSIEQKLLPWTDGHRSVDEVKHNYDEVTLDQIPEISTENVPTELKVQEWESVHDDFDYAALAERLK